MEKKEVTIIIPTLNEEKHIEKCMNSILCQSYNKEKISVIFVDGLSNDRTREIIKKYQEQYGDFIRLIDNPDKITPIAMNLGIQMANSDYIVRLDAHSEYPVDYIEKCINTIKRIDADNVGGLAVTKGIGKTGEAFAQVLSSKFGVGNSGFRTGAQSGYVDTVPFGTFKSEVFEKYGAYDERLARNQDYELNYRIVKNGGKVFLNSDIKLFYYCKNNIRSIMKQSFENGKWNVFTMKLCPGSMGKRHFIPLLFLISLIIMPIISFFSNIVKSVFLIELGLYVIMDIIFSLKENGAENKNQILLKLIIFPLFHISYGFGSLVGVLGLKNVH